MNAQAQRSAAGAEPQAAEERRRAAELQRKAATGKSYIGDSIRGVNNDGGILW